MFKWVHLNMAFVMQDEREHNTNKYIKIWKEVKKKKWNKFGKCSLRT